MGRVYAAVAGLFVILFLAAPASADPPATEPFPAGAWTFEMYGTYVWEYYPSAHERVASGVAGIGYFPIHNLSINLEFPYYDVRQPGSLNADAGGLNLLIRQFLYESGPWSTYFDIGGGLYLGNHITPPGGTYFNFTFQAGFGEALKIADHTYLMAGVRYFHLSNASIHGRNHNPDLNAGGAYAGMMFIF